MLEMVIQSGAVGAEIVISGRGVPSTRSRTWRFSAGHLKKSGDVAENLISKGFAVAHLKSGSVGVKVSILTPDIVLPDTIKIKSIVAEPQVEEVAEKVDEEVKEATKESTKEEEKKPSAKKEKIEKEVKEEIKEELQEEGMKKEVAEKVAEEVKEESAKEIVKEVTKVEPKKEEKVPTAEELAKKKSANKKE